MIGVHEHGRRWHTDGTTYEKLGLTTILYGIECPPGGRRHADRGRRGGVRVFAGGAAEGA